MSACPSALATGQAVPVNFVGHIATGLRAAGDGDDPAFLVGTALPDFASMRRTRLGPAVGPLADGIVSGGNVVCPLHAWKVDLASGEVTNQPAPPQCVKTFPVRVENGVISLEIAVAESATTHFRADCLAISQGPYLSNSASHEV